MVLRVVRQFWTMTEEYNFGYLLSCIRRSTDQRRSGNLHAPPSIVERLYFGVAEATHRNKRPSFSRPFASGSESNLVTPTEQPFVVTNKAIVFAFCSVRRIGINDVTGLRQIDYRFEIFREE